MAGVTMSFLRRFRQMKDSFHFPDMKDNQVDFYEYECRV